MGVSALASLCSARGNAEVSFRGANAWPGASAGTRARPRRGGAAAATRAWPPPGTSGSRLNHSIVETPGWPQAHAQRAVSKKRQSAPVADSRHPTGSLPCLAVRRIGELGARPILCGTATALDRSPSEVRSYSGPKKLAHECGHQRTAGGTAYAARPRRPQERRACSSRAERRRLEWKLFSVASGIRSHRFATTA
jgi:hypothetical protein